MVEQKFNGNALTSLALLDKTHGDKSVCIHHIEKRNEGLGIAQRTPFQTLAKTQGPASSVEQDGLPGMCWASPKLVQSESELIQSERDMHDSFRPKRHSLEHEPNAEQPMEFK